MFSLTYVSSANRRYSDRELQVLAAICARNNGRTEITGILLYKGGNFMQVLEGPEPAVRRLYSIIGCDTRHRGVILLVQGAIECRQFPHWAMRVEVVPDLAHTAGRGRDFLQALFVDVPPSAQRPPAQTLVMNFIEPF